ncbi:MAG: complex I subunit 1/NuoH family protein [Candidatus Micrarchaeia archaeon]|jgi:NADH-quinone oxidoreductase subunit H
MLIGESWLVSLLNSPSPYAEVLGLFVYAVLVGLLVILVDYFLGWLERKVVAKAQLRHGPTMVGKFGLLQNLADFTKLLAKSSYLPKRADRLLFTLALPFMLALAIFLILLLPLVPSLGFGNFASSLVLVFALFSFTPLFIFIVGASSGNKFAEIGAQRSVLMLLSYELPMIFVIASLGILARSLNLFAIVQAQSKIWYIFFLPIGFFVFFVSMLAELERSPFDLREADSELIAGWLTDVSAPSYTLALFLDYTKTFFGSLLMAMLFFGGWLGPALPGLAWLLIKALIIAVFIMLVRATAMRMRIDRVLRLGWYVLLPLAVVNLIIAFIV